MWTKFLEFQVSEASYKIKSKKNFGERSEQKISKKEIFLK